MAIDVAAIPAFVDPVDATRAWRVIGWCLRLLEEAERIAPPTSLLDRTPMGHGSRLRLATEIRTAHGPYSAADLRRWTAAAAAEWNAADDGRGYESKIKLDALAGAIPDAVTAAGEAAKAAIGPLIPSLPSLSLVAVAAIVLGVAVIVVVARAR